MANGKFSKPRGKREKPNLAERYGPRPEAFGPDPQEAETARLSEALLREEAIEEAPLPVPSEGDAPLDSLSDMAESLPEAYDSEYPSPDASYPEEELYPEDFVDKAILLFRAARGFCRQYRKEVLAVACAAVLLLAVCIIGLLTVKPGDPYEEKILNNVMIADVHVGGMTREEAAAALDSTLGSSLRETAMVVELPGAQLQLSPANTRVALDAQAAANAAYAIGRTGTKAEREQAYQASFTTNHIIALLPYLDLDESYIRNALEAYALEAGSILTQPSWELEGEAPDLSTDVFDPESDSQTLVITLGTPGIRFDAETVYNQILDAYSLHRFLVSATDTTETVQPEKPDLKAIYDECYLKPVEPTMNMSSFEPVPGAYGRQFDLEAAGQLLAAAKPGDKVHIPLEYPAPEEGTDVVLYQDILGSAQITCEGSGDVLDNIKKACRAINGTVLKPGENFSFLKVIGSGYETTDNCIGIEPEEVKGGGLCQVSSAIYRAALLADQQILERSSHIYPVAYAAYGFDAEVSWNNKDLQFRNSTSYPIRIQAEFGSGKIQIKLLGTEQRSYRPEVEYEVTGSTNPKTTHEYFSYDNEEEYDDGEVIQKGRIGYTVKTYRLRYDRLTGTLLAREFIATTTYKPQDEIIAVVEPEPTAPETEPTEPPTQPPTEAPTDPTTQPATEAATVPATQAPTEAATAPATQAPTEAATAPTTQAPTEAATAPTTQAPTEAATVPTTQAPTEASVPTDPTQPTQISVSGTDPTADPTTATQAPSDTETTGSTAASGPVS